MKVLLFRIETGEVLTGEVEKATLCRVYMKNKDPLVWAPQGTVFPDTPEIRESLNRCAEIFKQAESLKKQVESVLLKLRAEHPLLMPE